MCDLKDPLSRTWHADDAGELQSARFIEQAPGGHPQGWVPNWRAVHRRCWLWAGAGCESPVPAVTRVQGSAFCMGRCPRDRSHAQSEDVSAIVLVQDRVVGYDWYLASRVGPGAHVSMHA